MVLDIHHHSCNHMDDNLAVLLPDIISTWDGTDLPAKIHISSPKSSGDFRSHHDFVNPDDLYPFLKLARELNHDLDVMVEAKRKDQAMFKLAKELVNYSLIRKLATPPSYLNEVCGCYKY